MAQIPTKRHAVVAKKFSDSILSFFHIAGKEQEMIHFSWLSTSKLANTSENYVTRDVILKTK